MDDDDSDMPAESTVVDDGLQRQVLEEERWEESTVSEKQSKRRVEALAAPVAVRAPTPVPAPRRATTPRPVAPTPRAAQEDSANVLLDTVEEEQRALPTAVSDSPLSQMPTAIGANALMAQTRQGTAIGRLVVIGGNDRGREFVLTARETSLGRGADNDIILTDIAVSRRHIFLLFDGSRYGVRDLGSGNGTLCNGMRIQGEINIHDGDQLELGNTLLRFENPGVQSTVTSPPVGAPMTNGQPSGPPPLPPGGLGGIPLQANPSGSHPIYDASMLPPGSVPYSAFPPPQLPSGTPIMAFDLSSEQRKRLLMVGGGLLVIGALVGVIIALTASEPKGREMVSTEAESSPAMSKLIANVDATHGKSPAPTPTPTPPVTDVAPDPKPVTPPVVKDPPVDKTPVVQAPDQDVPPPKPKKEPKPDKRDKQVASVKPVKEPKDTSPKSGSAAEKSAASLYKEKQFDRAAEVLRGAAAKESGAAADRLQGLARDYAAVGAAMAKGDTNAASSPIVAMSAYQGALNVDSRAGKGVHGTYLRGQLGKVAPKAAMAQMNAQHYEQARTACDAAVNYGAGADPTVTKVRSLLEAKAKELYGQAQKLAKSKPADAKNMLRRVLKMVPAESPTYTKAYAALNKPTHTDEDEDE